MLRGTRRACCSVAIRGAECGQENEAARRAVTNQRDPVDLALEFDRHNLHPGPTRAVAIGPKALEETRDWYGDAGSDGRRICRDSALPLEDGHDFNDCHQ